jgi:hypothetical protein
MDPHSSRLFLGWLTSPGVISATDPEIADIAKLPNYLANRNFFDATGKVLNPASYEGQKLIDDLANPIAGTPDGVLIPLVGRGSVQLPTSVNRFGLEYSGQIDALPVPLPGATTLGGISTGQDLEVSLAIKPQDYWQTTFITEILEDRNEEDGTHYIRFKTGNSEYEWTRQ